MAVPLIIDLVILAELFERIQVIFIALSKLIENNPALLMSLSVFEYRLNVKELANLSLCIPFYQFSHTF